jgi:hypothetical protein
MHVLMSWLCLQAVLLRSIGTYTSTTACNSDVVTLMSLAYALVVPANVTAGHQPAQHQAAGPRGHRSQRTQDAPPCQRRGGLAAVGHRRRDCSAGDGGVL